MLEFSRRELQFKLDDVEYNNGAVAGGRIGAGQTSA